MSALDDGVTDLGQIRAGDVVYIDVAYRLTEANAAELKAGWTRLLPEGVTVVIGHAQSPRVLRFDSVAAELRRRVIEAVKDAQPQEPDGYGVAYAVAEALGLTEDEMRAILR